MKAVIRGLLIAICVSLGAGCAETPESSPRASSDETNSAVSDAILADARELAPELGISIEEAIAAIERQPLVGRLQKALAADGPTSFGGLFIDYVPEYRITLLALPGGADEIIRAVDELGFGELSSFAVTRETPYTEDVLKDAQRMVADLGGSKVTTLDLDIRTGKVVATTASSEDADAVSAAVDAADPPVPARRVVVREALGGGNLPGGAMAEDPAISVHPARVRVGDQAVLRVGRSRATWGLPWILEREKGSSWEWAGVLEAGPGKQWEEKFHLAPLEEGDIEDIGFTDPASMVLEIPELKPGRYRLGQDFIRAGRGSVENRTQWHYAEFEVVD